MRRKIRSTVSILLMFAMIFSLVPGTGAAFATATPPPSLPNNLKILEVEPWDTTGSFVISNTGNTPSGNNIGNSTISVTQMSMPTFVAKNEALNGNYDIIIFGQNKFKYGTAVNHVSSDYIDSSMTSLTFDTDISTKKALQLEDFANYTNTAANSGQCIVADLSKIDQQSVLYTELTKIRAAKTDKVYSATSANFTNTILATEYAKHAQRPVLTLSNKPTNYSASSDSNLFGAYSSGHRMNFSFRIDTPNMVNSVKNKMTAKLYIDGNGDGLFSPTESVSALTGLVANPGNGDGLYTLAYDVDSHYTGVLPWKLEVTDETSKAKVWQVGYPGFKGDALTIRVLQILPNNSSGASVSLLDMSNNTSTIYNKLSKSGEYSIVVKSVTIRNLNQAYKNASDTMTDITGASIPSKLNGHYDMVVFGFADSFGNSNDDSKAFGTKYFDGSDLVNWNGSTWANGDFNTVTGANANTSFISDLKNFISASKQSVMFTHDTIGPQDGAADTTAHFYNDCKTITNNFKLLAGFADSLPGFNNTRTYSNIHGQSFTPTDVTSALKVNTGIVTQYPYVLPDTLTIAKTHGQWWKLDSNADDVIPWYSLNTSNRSELPEDYYYTFSKGNVTFSGTGHSSPSGDQEQKLFVNTILKASMAANHAPAVSLSGNPDKIPASQNQISFNYTVSDEDTIIDKDFTVQVYIDKTNDGTYETTGPSYSLTNANGIQQVASLDSTLIPTSAGTFGVKLVATDSHGAKSPDAIFSVSKVNTPTITLSGATDATGGGYLVGDTAHISYTVTANGGTNVSQLQNVTLNSVSLAATGFQTGIAPIADSHWAVGSGNTSASDSLTNITFANQVVSPATQTATLGISLTALPPANMNGSYSINGAVSCNSSPAGYAPSSSTNGLTIPVKAGSITANVRSKTHQGLNNITVTLTKGTNTWYGTTDSTGQYTFSNLPTGTYTLIATPPTGAAFVNAQVSIDLNYGNNSPTAFFDVSNDMVVVSNFRDASGNVISKTYPSGLVSGKIQFVLGGTADLLKFNLLNLSPAITFSSPTLVDSSGVDKGVVTMADGANNTKVFILPATASSSLAGGTYYLKFNMIIPNTMPVTTGGSYQKMMVGSINYRDHNLTYALTTDYDSVTYVNPDTHFVNDNTPILNLNILMRPKLH